MKDGLFSCFWRGAGRQTDRQGSAGRGEGQSGTRSHQPPQTLGGKRRIMPPSGASIGSFRPAISSRDDPEYQDSETSNGFQRQPPVPSRRKASTPIPIEHKCCKHRLYIRPKLPPGYDVYDLGSGYSIGPPFDGRVRTPTGRVQTPTPTQGHYREHDFDHYSGLGRGRGHKPEDFIIHRHKRNVIGQDYTDHGLRRGHWQDDYITLGHGLGRGHIRDEYIVHGHGRGQSREGYTLKGHNMGHGREDCSPIYAQVIRKPGQEYFPSNRRRLSHEDEYVPSNRRRLSQEDGRPLRGILKKSKDLNYILPYPYQVSVNSHLEIRKTNVLTVSLSLRNVVST